MRLFRLVRLSVCPSVVIYQLRCQQEDFCDLWQWGSKFASIPVKISATLHEDLSTFCCCRRFETAVKALCPSGILSACYSGWGGINIKWTRRNTYMACLLCTFFPVMSVFSFFFILSFFLHFSLSFDGFFWFSQTTIWSMKFIQELHVKLEFLPRKKLCLHYKYEFMCLQCV
jgi:hypothetical protein